MAARSLCLGTNSAPGAAGTSGSRGSSGARCSQFMTMWGIECSRPPRKEQGLLCIFCVLCEALKSLCNVQHACGEALCCLFLWFHAKIEQEEFVINSLQVFSEKKRKNKVGWAPIRLLDKSKLSQQEWSNITVHVCLGHRPAFILLWNRTACFGSFWSGHEIWNHGVSENISPEPTHWGISTRVESQLQKDLEEWFSSVRGQRWRNEKIL